MDRYTKRLKLGIYGNDDEQILNTNQFDHNMEQIEEFGLETDQKFIDESLAREKDKSDLIKIIQMNKQSFDNHAANKENPHNVTKEQLHIERVDNTNDLEKPISNATALAIDGITTQLNNHESDKTNPHEVTKDQVGLGNADNTSDINKPVSTAQAAAIKTVQDDITAHKGSKTNPHSVSKAQVGLGNVPNVTTNDQTPSYTAATALAALESGEKLSVAFGKLAKVTADLITHLANKSNPHGVTASQAGAYTKAETDTKVKVVNDSLNSHAGDKSNPHAVTKAQVGLGNVPNVITNDQTPSYTVSATLAALVSGEKLNVAFGKLAKAVSDLIAHIANKSNPHGVTASQAGAYTKAEADAKVKIVNDTLTSHSGNKSNPHTVTKAQVGLGNVTNDSQVKRSEMGVANGVATLGSDGTVPESQLPSYVDDVLEFASKSSFPASGESGKIYVSLNDNLTYRWSGTAYVEISKSLALGETASTAYAGDKGKSTTDSLNTHKADTTAHITATERTNWNDANSKKHAHSNKSLLDTYTQTEANLKGAVDSKHTHGNKSVIDGITAALITAWNGAVNAQHSHSNKALLDTYTQTEANLASAVSSKHTHSNKAIIDKITQAMLDTWDTVSGKAAAVHKHVKSDITDFPASLKNPTSLIVKLNGGTTEGTNQFTYDGSSAKNVNVTPAGIGAATSNHVHTSVNDSGNGDPTTFAYSKAGLETTSWFAAWNGKELRAISPANVLKTIGAAATSHSHTKAQISDFAHTHDDRYYTEAEIDTKVKTINDTIASKGGGDMLKSVYDTNDDGTVDKAATVPWSGVTGKPSTFAPSSHTHTKGQISDFPTSLPANGGTANYLNAIAIPANANLNSYTTPGFYYCAANATVATMTNAPSDNAFFMIVGKHAGTFQMFVEYTVSSQKIYIRNYYGSWGSWQRIFTTANKPTLSELGAAATSHTHTKSQISDFPSSLPANGGNAATVGGFTVGVNVPANAKFTDTVYTHPAYTARSSGLYKITVDAKGHVSAVTAVAKADITALGIPGQDTNTVYTHPTTAGNKHIPSGGSSGQILRWSADGTAVWGADNNTTYNVFKAATASAAGGSGLVPAPSAGAQAKYLRADGTWQTPPNTTYGLATASTNGLMPATYVAKVDKLRPENVIKNVTIATTSFVENTDENKDYYPYFADYAISGMTANSWAEVNLSAASDSLGVLERWNTMAGKIRLYTNAVPSAAIVIDNILWKEVG